MTELICITCPKGCHLVVEEADGFSVSGNECPRGKAYARKEVTNPTRTLTSTVRISGADIPRLPVKSVGEVPKNLMVPIAALLDGVDVRAPAALGEVILKDALGTGVDIVATRSLTRALGCD